MTIPQRFTLRNSAYALDGGTTHLMGTDDQGKQHNVVLAQSAFPKRSSSSRLIPGRLYFDGELVAVRSTEEAAIVTMLRSAEIVVASPPPGEGGERIDLSKRTLILGDDIRQVLTRTPEENLRALSAAVVERVTSPEYVSFASKAGG